MGRREVSLGKEESQQSLLSCKLLLCMITASYYYGQLEHDPLENLEWQWKPLFSVVPTKAKEASISSFQIPVFHCTKAVSGSSNRFPFKSIIQVCLLQYILPQCRIWYQVGHKHVCPTWFCAWLQKNYNPKWLGCGSRSCTDYSTDNCSLCHQPEILPGRTLAEEENDKEIRTHKLSWHSWAVYHRLNFGILNPSDGPFSLWNTDSWMILSLVSFSSLIVTWSWISRYLWITVRFLKREWECVSRHCHTNSWLKFSLPRGNICSRDVRGAWWRCIIPKLCVELNPSSQQNGFFLYNPPSETLFLSTHTS